MLRRIKQSEFYEKYWKVDDGHGNMVSPPPLTEGEKKYLDDITSSQINCFHIKFTRKPTGQVIDIDLEKLEKQMKQLPGFLKICGCGSCTEEYQHQSDCAVHNMPAMPNGKCDCKPKPFKPSKKHLAIFKKIAEKGYYKPTYSDKEPTTKTLEKKGIVEWRDDFRGLRLTKKGEELVKLNGW